ncbi:hypothetical protein QR680_011461 [Steinernema hermaphroditum]|uniref:BTB domain-containing protein n=1 Tax=Steinernema hermaphroditum TaxID=289476 RepID=A0AA39I106_9BILA|nr:hypothetical protein QR680_011461 [Steinernema hermaphroditum]
MLLLNSEKTESSGNLTLSIAWKEIEDGNVIFTPPTSIGGLQWKFQVCYDVVKKDMKIDLRCVTAEENDCLLYWVQIKKMLKYSEVDGMSSTSWCGSYSYNKWFGFLAVKNANKAVDENGNINLDITIKIERMVCFDLSKYNPASADTLLTLRNSDGDTSIYVSKSALSMQSDFFNNFFNNQSFIEGRSEAYELKQVDFKAFCVVLYDVYGLPVDFNKSGMDASVIKEAINLADRFQLTMTIVRFEKALLALDKSTRHDWLEFADKHRMDTFVYEAVSSLSLRDLARLSVGGLRRFSEETAQMIMKKMEIA